MLTYLCAEVAEVVGRELVAHRDVELPRAEPRTVGTVIAKVLTCAPPSSRQYYHRDPAHTRSISYRRGCEIRAVDETLTCAVARRSLGGRAIG